MNLEKQDLSSFIINVSYRFLQEDKIYFYWNKNSELINKFIEVSDFSFLRPINYENNYGNLINSYSYLSNFDASLVLYFMYLIVLDNELENLVLDNSEDYSKKFRNSFKMQFEKNKMTHTRKTFLEKFEDSFIEKIIIILRINRNKIEKIYKQKKNDLSIQSLWRRINNFDISHDFEQKKLDDLINNYFDNYQKSKWFEKDSLGNLKPNKYAYIDLLLDFIKFCINENI